MEEVDTAFHKHVQGRDTKPVCAHQNKQQRKPCASPGLLRREYRNPNIAVNFTGPAFGLTYVGNTWTSFAV